MVWPFSLFTVAKAKNADEERPSKHIVERGKVVRKQYFVVVVQTDSGARTLNTFCFTMAPLVKVGDIVEYTYSRNGDQINLERFVIVWPDILQPNYYEGATMNTERVVKGIVLRKDAVYHHETTWLHVALEVYENDVRKGEVIVFSVKVNRFIEAQIIEPGDMIELGFTVHKGEIWIRRLNILTANPSAAADTDHQSS